ncbi:hypothetical protein [Streptomyces antimicrobicus]|uniref:Uncharacterized protein n=1 Tax=Streptomyces antimicrobicus TaxID=2883108 RepID=A0ABS8B9C3_9ACTN|nr:hypothetical protein [Streptomyces antimicrobicus]MCB5181192.1 hypothetical protein [Streptomyces antimicrobicus]
MSAPTHPRPVTRSGTGADARLHWWALALPTLAFVLLLLLLAGSGQAHAAADDGSALAHVADRILRALG